MRNKNLKNYFDISVVVDIGCGNTNEKQGFFKGHTCM